MRIEVQQLRLRVLGFASWQLMGLRVMSTEHQVLHKQWKVRPWGLSGSAFLGSGFSGLDLRGRDRRFDSGLGLALYSFKDRTS